MEKVLGFDGFLFESQNPPSNIKVIVLSGTNKPSKTSKQFEKVCKDRGVECHIINVNNANVLRMNKKTNFV